MWGNNKAWRSQARIPEPGQPSCLHRTPPGERWRDGHGETEARSCAGLTLLLDNRESGALPLCVSPDSRGIQGDTALSQSTKLGWQRRAPLASPRQHLQSQGHPVLTVNARGHRGASATPPSSRLLPMRHCPPPKISCSPCCPLPGHPPQPGELCQHTLRVRPDPPAAKGEGDRAASSITHTSPATRPPALPGSSAAPQSPRCLRLAGVCPRVSSGSAL